MDLVECIDDTDRNGVFKITPDLNQVFKVMQSTAAGTSKTQIYDLSGLDFEAVG